MTSKAATPGRKPDRQFVGRWVLVVFGLLLAYGAAEILSLVTISVQDRRFLPLGALRQQQIDRASENFNTIAGEIPAEPAVSVVHPYLGYVGNPAADGSGLVSSKQYSVSDYGFRDDLTPFHTRGEDTLIIAILGGSVAYRFSAGPGAMAMVEELQTYPGFENKKPVIVRVGMDGYKQPQQLMVLNYLLALGAEFDVVINVDGFNEVALPGSTNTPNGVFAFFPRSWHLLVADLPDPRVQKKLGIISFLDYRRSQWARLSLAPPFCYSATAMLVWRIRDNSLNNSLITEHAALEAIDPPEALFQATGPHIKYEDDAELMVALVDMWRRSSIQMNTLCEHEETLYLHFLQPNQYVADSKIFTADEERTAILEGHPYRGGAEAGYPLLVGAGETLAAEGVFFEDLTQIFRDTPESIYEDSCCHLDDRGNEILGRRIARTIAEHYDPDRPAPVVNIFATS